MQNQYFCYYYIKLAEAWITLNSKVTWTCQIKVSIGNVFGCNHQGCNRSNLVMARYARPRSHIPHCPHPRVVTGWQVSTHWVTDASQHIATRHLRPVMGSLAVFLLQWKKRYEKCCLIIVVWCSLVPTFRPARNYRLLLPTKTGLWALRSQAQGEWTGAGSQAGAGTEPGASSRDRVGGMLLLGNRLIYFLMRARRERSRHESAGAVGEMRNSTFVGTFIWNLFSQHKGLLPRRPQFLNTWCPKKINF